MVNCDKKDIIIVIAIPTFSHDNIFCYYYFISRKDTSMQHPIVDTDDTSVYARKYCVCTINNGKHL